MTAPDAPIEPDDDATAPGEAAGDGRAPEPIDLDRLIGELETEGARRRAEPDYPHDRDAELHFELDRRAPSPSQPDALGELVAEVDSAVSGLVEIVPAAPGSAPTARSGSTSRRRDRGRRPRVDEQVTSVGLAVAAALRAISDRLERLEAQVASLGPAGPATESAASAGSEAAFPGAALQAWRARLIEAPASVAGRVLYADADADAVVAELRAAGLDAYGVTTAGPRHRPGPDVRTGDLITHLHAVGDGALAAAVLAGVPETMTPSAVGPVVAELGRAARTVIVVSEAPWWWRRRLGAVQADLAPGRPLDPDTWLDAFHAVGLAGSAAYDPAGRSYRVVVGTPA